MNTIRTVLVALSLLVAVSCTQRRQAPPPRPQVTYLDHTIRYQGETLALISSWYTGSGNNWQDILSHNPGLDPRRLRPGDLVRIPRSLLSREEPLPQKFVMNARAKVDSSVVSPPTEQALQDTQASQEGRAALGTTEVAPTEVNADDAQRIAEEERQRANEELTKSLEQARQDQQNAIDQANTATQEAQNQANEAAIKAETQADEALPTDPAQAEADRSKKRQQLLQELLGGLVGGGNAQQGENAPPQAGN